MGRLPPIDPRARGVIRASGITENLSAVCRLSKDGWRLRLKQDQEDQPKTKQDHLPVLERHVWSSSALRARRFVGRNSCERSTGRRRRRRCEQFKWLSGKWKRSHSATLLFPISKWNRRKGLWRWRQFSKTDFIHLDPSPLGFAPTSFLWDEYQTEMR